MEIKGNHSNAYQTVLYYEEGMWLDDKLCGDETQLLMEYIFQNNIQVDGYTINKGKDELLDFRDNLYEWFEIWEDDKKLCFGWWDEYDASIKWFITKEEVDKVKSKIK